jgi:hypothetical protein
MKNIILSAALLLPNLAWSYDDNPYTPFDATKKLRETSIITWRTVDDVQKACNNERIKAGGQKFNQAITACAVFYFNNNTCTIITGKKTNMHALGHEVRHCFQGHWHQ